jgi:hypothetical protein
MDWKKLSWKKSGSKASRGAPSPWEGVDYLDLVPRHAVAFEAGAEGQIVLLVPRYRDGLWGRLIQPRLGPAKRFVRVPLETRGSALWRAMDGQQSVRALLAAASAAAPDDDEDLARRVCLYVQNLADNGFVRLAGVGPAERLGA